MSLAALPARLGLVVSPTARVRLSAPVFPRSALWLLGNRQRSRAVVQPGPFQTDRLALPSAGGERKNESHAISAPKRRLDQALNVVDFEWLDLVLFDSRSLRELDWVSVDVPAAQRLAKRCAGGSMHLVGCGRLASSGQDLGVQLLEVLAGVRGFPRGVGRRRWRRGSVNGRRQAVTRSRRSPAVTSARERPFDADGLGLGFSSSQFATVRRRPFAKHRR